MTVFYHGAVPNQQKNSPKISGMLRSKIKTIAELKESARAGYRTYYESMHDIILDEWPAWEYFHTFWGGSPIDYFERWRRNEGHIFSGLAGAMMIALKDDPIWGKISVFGLPYPPFDKYDVMWVRDIDRATAEHFGILTREQKVVLPPRSWEDDIKLISRHPIIDNGQ